MDNINRVTSENRETWILGDLNIDLFNNQNLQHKFYENMMTQGLNQLISSSTRIPSRTCIDHIYTNEPLNVLETKVPDIGISDHRPVCATRKYNGKLLQNPSHKIIYHRCFKNFDVKKFKEDLTAIPWNTLDLFDNPNDKWDIFYSLYMDVVNNHAPLKEKRVKFNQQPKWFSNELNDMIKRRNYLLRKSRGCSKNSTEWHEYRVFRNTVRQTVRKTKRTYFQDTLEKNKANSKELWSHLKSFNPKRSNIGPTPNQTPPVSKNSQDEEIADLFNKHFTSLKAPRGKTSESNIEFARLRDFINSKELPDIPFNFSFIDEKFIIDQIKGMPERKGTGLDGISVKLLKASIPTVAQPLVNIINGSIKSGVYPSQFKLAKVCPIFKKGNVNDLSNYRPIAVLPIISKIMERHLHKEMTSFIEQYKLLNDNQSGFRAKHSCETLLIKLTDHFLENMDKGLINTALMIDLSKAFDLVDHAFLLKKISYYNFGTDAMNMLRSFLHDRRQKVIFRGKLSNERQTQTIGIPQGSILSPLLFTIYLNDLTLHITNSNIDMYADDMTLYTAKQNPIEINSCLNSDLCPLLSWLQENRLMINTEKTELISICTRQKSMLTEDVFLEINSNQIKKVKYQKLLGLFLDNNLTWKQHISHVIKKINTRLALLRRIKCFLPRFGRILFYNSMIQPIIDYGLSIYSTCAKEDLKRVHKVQKRAGRTILDIRKAQDISTVDLFQQLDWIPIDERAKLQVATLMYKCNNNLVPEYLSNKFSNVSTRTTRAKVNGNLSIPKCKTNSGQRTFNYRGVSIWNSLSREVKLSSSTENFKKHYMNQIPNIYDQKFNLDI